MLVKYTVSEFLSAKGSFSSIDLYKSRIISTDHKKSLKYWGLNNLTCMISFEVLLYAYPAKTVM